VCVCVLYLYWKEGRPPPARWSRSSICIYILYFLYTCMHMYLLYVLHIYVSCVPKYMFVGGAAYIDLEHNIYMYIYV
jgi:hypothetical protein